MIDEPILILVILTSHRVNEKLRLSKELEKEIRYRKLTELLETFQTDELYLDTINKEVETVRAEIYAKPKTN